MKKILIILVLLFVYSISHCQEMQPDNETKQVCNEAMSKIYGDILRLKGSYKELKKFDRSALQQKENEFSSIGYSYNIELLSKGERGTKFGDNAFGVTLSIVHIDAVWQAANIFENLSYPNLGIKFYGFFIQPQPPQSDLAKRISAIVRKHSQLVNNLDQKHSPLQLTIKSDKEVYEIGDEFTVFFSLQNVSNKTINFYHSERPELFAISVRKRDGTYCPIGGFQVQQPRIQLVSLNLGETLEYSEKGKIVQRRGYLPGRGGKFDNRREVTGIFVEFSANPSVFLENGNDSYIISGYYKDATYEFYDLSGSRDKKSYDQFLLENKDKWQGTLISNTIAIEVVEKKGISKAEILKIAKMMCKESGWEWNNINIYEENNRWHIVTKSLQNGDKIRIFIDKYTGEVLNVFRGFE